MTPEDFAHRCLMIKAGNVELAIPCCANCEYYQLEEDADFAGTIKGGILAFAKLSFGFEEKEEEEKEYKFVCNHPVLETHDSFDAAWLETKPEDFCSRWEGRNEEKKKLKKRIKRLEKESQTIIDKIAETLNAQHQILCALRDRISALDDSITKNDQSYKSQFGTIKNSVREIRNMVDILKQRTDTDYTKFKPLVDTSKGPDTVFVTGEEIKEN